MTNSLKSDYFLFSWISSHFTPEFNKKLNIPHSVGAPLATLTPLTV
jgi:hypothetical protein